MAKKQRGTTEDEADALIAEYGKSKQRGTVCSIKASGHAALIDALLARGVAMSRISLILSENKSVQLGISAIGRHASKACLCQR